MTEIFKNIIYMARRFKLATAFNLLGLIVAFAAFYLMMTQVIYQATYNHDVEDCERLYRIDTDYRNNHGLYSDEIFYPIARILDSMPEVESYSLMYRIYDDDPVVADYYKLSFLKRDGDTIRFTDEYNCNETAVSTLASRRQVLKGSIDWRDSIIKPRPLREGVIIPASIAMEYFGSIDVIGDSMMVVAQEKAIPWSIRGVYQDFPENSELRNCVYEKIQDADKEAYKYDLTPSFKCIIKFKQAPHDVEAMNNSLKLSLLDLMDKEGWDNYAEASGISVQSLKQFINDMHISLTPLKESYFVTKTLSSGEHGFKPMFVILELACLLLIILAAIHFLNFALVESPMRIRGINTRLVLGASRRSLQRGIIVECVIISVIACVIALIICGALSSWSSVDQLIDGTLALHRHGMLVLSTIAVAGVVGIAAGIYPATFATSFTPAMALKGNFGLTPQGHRLRKVILGFQLFISFLMAIYMATLIPEWLYILNSNYGYNKSNVHISSLPLTTSDIKKQEIIKELASLPGVKGVSFSDGTLGLSDSHGGEPIELHDHSLNLDYSLVDCHYMIDMGIDIIEGRHFIPEDSAAIILNKAAHEQLDWLSLGMKIPPIMGEDSLTVVGFCDNIRYNTTRFNNNQPFAFIVEAGSEWYLSSLNINIDRNTESETLDKANSILRKHLDKEAKPLMSFDSKLQETYETEFRYFKWIFIISLACTLITLIGVFCLTMFETEYRRKEIGIRKVAGAKSGEIILMLCHQYIPSILISFAVAAPIAYICGEQTLAYFAEHTPIHWWIYPLALLIVGGIVMSTILLQSWRAARENPVNSIKTE